MKIAKLEMLSSTGKYGRFNLEDIEEIYFMFELNNENQPFLMEGMFTEDWEYLSKDYFSDISDIEVKQLTKDTEIFNDLQQLLTSYAAKNQLKNATCNLETRRNFQIEIIFKKDQ
ncbi:hypothetical protein [Enterococcus sp. CWB-B31]|uniref:hypothetical protein n=1 Tax=Enterococcus sp. CWB-B31 TaxID=2885159 RepID=UPI001E29DF8A|nr:hypothetical protein [Enterococcus sp. CWB-B31]MCB5953673.1 hypothetical protein [Enterococcus sp. CWB-B31]